MKKLLLVVATALLSSSAAFSQKGVKFSATLMPQACRLNNIDDIDQKPEVYSRKMLHSMGQSLGIGYHFSPYFGVKTALQYSTQGGRHTQRKDFDTDITTVTRLRYAQIPLMMGFNTDPDRKTAFAIWGGYQFGYLTSAKVWSDNTTLTNPIPAGASSYPTSYQVYNKWQRSIVGQAGVDVHLGENWTFNLYAYGNYGLNDAENKDATFRLTQNGQTRTTEYWSDKNTSLAAMGLRGGVARAETRQVTFGVSIGLTYTLPAKPKEEAPATEAAEMETPDAAEPTDK